MGIVESVHQVFGGSGEKVVITLVNAAKVPFREWRSGPSPTAFLSVLQKYADLFSTYWNLPCELVFGSTREPDPNTWDIVFVDDASQAGALGYHEVDKLHQPISYVFVKTTLGAGEPVSVTTSHELCLSGDTEIPLLDGTVAKIKDLVGRDPFWVYSCTKDGQIRPGRAHSVRRTKRNAKVVRVSLDNGQSIRCTADHRIMRRDGTYSQAQNLRPGDSLMPLYRRRIPMPGPKKTGKRYDYEQVYVPALDDWLFTHRIVVPKCGSGNVRHHKDYNRFNNTPENIEVMTWEDHQEHHSKLIGQRAKENAGKPRNIPPEVRAKWAKIGSEVLTRYNKSDKHKEDMARYYDQPGVREKHGSRLGEHARTEGDRKRRAELARTPEMRDQARKNITRYNKSAKHRKVAAKLGRKMFQESWEQDRDKNLERSSWGGHLRWHAGRGVWKDDCRHCLAEAAAGNHKVVSVDTVLDREDVYDLTVDEYHNFATSVGVFVHNCEMLADPAINLCAVSGKGNVVAYETADACQSDVFSLDGIAVSDFVTPAYFEPFRKPGSVRFDHLNKVDRPFRILKGGYLPIFRNGRWEQMFGSQEAKGKFIKSDQRLHRNWRRRLASEPNHLIRNSLVAIPEGDSWHLPITAGVADLC